MRQVPLSKGMVALVDDEDYELVSRYTWHVANGGKHHIYAGTDIQEKKVRMHVLLMNFPDSRVDHRDGNGLNNQRANLRLATPQQNTANSRLSRGNKTGYKGVRSHRKKWIAYIRPNGRQICLGSFKTPEEAAEAYNKAALIHFGEFANLNVIPGGTT